jgi:CheY-like chemotaxis protein
MKSGNALLTIINDILDFSKIDAGQLVLDPAPFNLAEAIEDVATLVSTRAKEKDLELIVRVQPGLHRHLCRRCRPYPADHHQPDRQCGEVHRYRPRSGGGHRRACRNRNTPENQRSPIRALAFRPTSSTTVFEKFSQVDASSTRRHEGTGLGLAITSRLVDADGRARSASKASKAGLDLLVHHRRSSTPAGWGGKRHANGRDRRAHSHRRRQRRQPLDPVEQMASWGFDACAAESGKEGIEVLKAAASFGSRGRLHYPRLPDARHDRRRGGAHHPLDQAGIADVPIVMLTSVDQSLTGAITATWRSTRNSSSRCAHRCCLKRLSPRSRSAGRALVVTTPIRPRSTECRSARDVMSGPRPAIVAAPRRPIEKAKRNPDATSGLDILVAEDNEVNQLVFTQILSETSYRFEIVGNGQLAVEAYREMQPRMILMDVSMPEMNGLEATGAIREIEEQSGRHVPIVGVTAHALKGDRERCLEAGMDDYLSKPISPKALLEKVETWMANGGAARKVG